jgi:Ras-related protein Rab-4B
MEYQYKVILIGPSAVGKTSLLDRFIHNQFSQSYKLTIGVDFMNKDITIGDSTVKLNIWDIGGQDRFKAVRKSFYSGVSGALSIFDLTRAATYEGVIDKWYPEMMQFASSEVPFILIGNKKDLIGDIGQAIESNIPEEFAAKNESIYIETSAKTGENVEEAFIKLAQRILSNFIS